MRCESARLRVKTWLCLPLLISSHVAGNFFMKRGVPSELASPLDYITALFRPWLALGVLLLIVWMLLRMALLSWADLSYVLPVTSIGYALAAVMGRMAAYSGKEVTWEQALNSQWNLFPDPLTWDMSLAIPPMAVPGQTQFS